MWTFHPSVGFFSAVIDRQKPGNMLVRFRDPSHGAAFIALAWKGKRGQKPELRETPQADYRWKVSITGERFTATVTALADAVDYSNFKGECRRRPLMGSAMHSLHDVWHVMHEHQNAVVERRAMAARTAQREAAGEPVDVELFPLHD